MLYYEGYGYFNLTHVHVVLKTEFLDYGPFQLFCLCKISNNSETVKIAFMTGSSWQNALLSELIFRKLSHMNVH